MNGEAKELLDEVRMMLNAIDHLPERVEVINEFKKVLHECSPMRTEPVDCVLWVPCDDVQANDYNPNSVAPPEMQLL